MQRVPPKHILVPVDFTEPSLAALDSAKRLGGLSDAVLEIVYVFDFTPHLAYGGAELKVPPAELKQHRRLIERDLKRAASGYPAQRLKVRIEEGGPSAVLSRLSEKQSCGMVVMGTHGYAGVQHMLYGSVAENVVRSARVPVLAQHKEAKLAALKRILVPVNLTDYADEALFYALALADAAKAAVSVIYVAQESAVLSDGMAALEEHLAGALGAKKAAGIKKLVRAGSPEGAILEEADKGAHDLIVLSAHKKPFWKDWVLGMTAERVLRHSRVPVLAVPTGTLSRKSAALTS